MLKFLSRAVSILFHPVLMPLIGTVIIFFSGTTLSIMDRHVMKLLYLFVLVITVILPVSVTLLLVYLKTVPSIQMKNSRERVIPYFLTFIFYYAAHYFINRLNINYYFSVYLFSGAILVLIILIVSYFWKISTHMAGIGGITGLILSLSYEFNSDMMYFFILAIIIAGILGSARLKLNSHTPSQVYAGFLTGMVVVAGIIHLLYSYTV